MMHPENTEPMAFIPHRPPFLWVDKIVSVTESEIVTEKHISPDLDVFAGHYPNNPIMPGVLLCEAVFQTGAILMAHGERNQKDTNAQIPVLTRIQSAKFKKIVKPGDTVQMHVKCLETISGVTYFKGSVRSGGKTAVQVEFSCALVAKMD